MTVTRDPFICCLES